MQQSLNRVSTYSLFTEKTERENIEKVKSIWNSLDQKKRVKLIVIVAAVIVVYGYFMANTLFRGAPAQEAPIYPYQSGNTNAVQIVTLILTIANTSFLAYTFIKQRKAPQTEAEKAAAKAKRKEELLKELKDLEHENTTQELSPETPEPPPPPPPPPKSKKRQKDNSVQAPQAKHKRILRKEPEEES